MSSAADQVDVTVLIPTLNEEAHLEQTLDTLRRQRFDGAIEFLFIDGGSRDGTRAVLERAAAADPRIRLLENPRGGIPYALNIGLRSARGTYVARMDAHTFYPAEYISQGVERLKHTGAAWVNGPQIPIGVDRWSRIIAAALSTRLGIGGASFRNATREIEVDTGFTGLWLRSTLLAHGGWDERWVVNEDAELGARLREAGGRIVCVPDMAARYIPRNSLKALARQYWRYGHYRAKTSDAHPESMRRSHVLPPALALSVGIAALPSRAASRPARFALAAYAAVIGGTAISQRDAGSGGSAGIALALVMMHLAWGFGFLAGCVRFGPPVAALRSTLASVGRRQ